LRDACESALRASVSAPRQGRCDHIEMTVVEDVSNMIAYREEIPE